MDTTIAFKDYVLFDIEAVEYIAWPEVEADTIVAMAREKCCITAIPLINGEPLTENYVRSFLEEALQTDDVFHRAFLSGIIFYGEKDPLIGSSLRKYLLGHGNRWIRFVDVADIRGTLFAGPWLLRQGCLWKVSRLYEDTASAFSIGLREQPDMSPAILQFLGSGQTPAVAAPSRLRAWRSPSGSPLRGIRVTVKEIFDIVGLKTGLGSRPYAELYPPATSTAPAIQRLLDAGIDLLGISKMCSMVLKAPPTQCIDYIAPFNPRGDGYQSPSGGSSGQAAAVAANEWLDFAIGTDYVDYSATFSGRMPAQANGCFSLRPTVGVLSTEGMWSGVPQFDTPCLFGRNIAKFNKLLNIWYGDTPCRNDSSDLPLTVLVPPDSFNTGDDDQRQIFADFVADLQKFADVEVEYASIPDLWDEHPPDAANGKALRDYLSEEVATSGYIYTFWQRVSTFFEDYQTIFDKLPFMPPPKGIHRWDGARAVSEAQHRDALYVLATYKSWLLSRYLQSHLRNVILISPLGEVEPCYRDAWPKIESLDQQLWEPLLIAPIVGAPEIVVPAGQKYYESRISGRREPLPVCISIMGLPGMMLLINPFDSEPLLKIHSNGSIGSWLRVEGQQKFQWAGTCTRITIHILPNKGLFDRKLLR